MTALVVGGGIMGLSTARALVQAGRRVVLVERGPLPNPLASSMDRHRLIRFMYGQNHGYAAMVAEAYPAWERLWADLGRMHYVPTGQLLTGPVDDTWVAGSRRSLRALGIALAELDQGAIGRRFPLVDAAAADYALYSPTAGALLADRICHDLAAWLGEAGAELRPETEVLDIDPECGRIRLADGTMLQGEPLIVAAGAWTGRLLPDLASRLTPSRQAVLYVEPPAVLAGLWQTTTMLTDVLTGEAPSVFYAVPPVGDTPIKFGDHCFSRNGDVDADRTPTRDEIARVMAAARRRLRDADAYRITEARTCFYTLSPDERFIAEATGPTITLAGFSGHGFKFGPLIGERLAEVVAGRLDFASFRDWLAGATADTADGARTS